jgi:hypothetical protein
MDPLANDMGKRGATGNKSPKHKWRVDKKSGMHRQNKYMHRKGKGRK